MKSLKKYLFIGTLSIFLFSFHQSVQAITYTFTATMGNDWNEPANWDVYPGINIGAGDIAVIPASETIIIPSAVTINMSAGGTINNAGTFTVDGTLNNFGTFNNSGTLTINNGGLLSVQGFATLASTGTMTVGGTLSNEMFGTIQVSNCTIQAMGTLVSLSESVFTSTGSFTVQSPMDVYGYIGLNNLCTANFHDQVNIQIGGSIVNNLGSTCTIQPTATIDINGYLYNYGTYQNNGIININAGGAMSIYQNISNTGTINLNVAGEFSFNGPGNQLPGGTFNWNTGGVLEINSNTVVTLSSNLTMPNGGSINVLFNGELVIPIGITLINDGFVSVNGNVIINGTFTINAGATLQNDMTGNIQGTGTIINNGTINNNGTIAPGLSPGTLTVTGDANLGAGTYACEINGTTAGTQHDVIDVSGQVTISNTKLVVNWGAFVPDIGDMYAIMNYGSRVGTFSMITIPPVAGKSFTVSYTGTNVIITVTAAMPVELTAWTGIAKNKTIELSWTTASESNNRGFHIEKITETNIWTEIAFVAGGGTRAEEQHYQWNDHKPLKGLNYYRLVQEDQNGIQTKSQVIGVEYDQDIVIKPTLYPNPVVGNVINLQGVEGFGYGELMSLTGQRVAVIYWNENGDVNIPSLVEGLYVLRVGEKVVLPLVIQN